MNLVVSSTVGGVYEQIALRINVCEDDWTAEWAFTASSNMVAFDMQTKVLDWTKQFKIDHSDMKLLQPICCASNSHSSTYFCHNIIRHIYCIPDPLIPPTRHNKGVPTWCTTPQGCSLQTRRSILKRYPTLISRSYAPHIFPCPFINLQPSYLSMIVYSVFNVI